MAIMTYDVLGARHFAADQIPIVLIGGMTLLRGDWERLANALAEVQPVQQARTLPNLNFNAPHSSIPSSIPILVIHGQNDAFAPLSWSQVTLLLIPHALAVDVWVGVIEEFMKVRSGSVKAKL